MSQIRCIYFPVDGKPHQPPFDATDQHPKAVRYLVGDYYVDAIDGEPSAEELYAALNPPPPPKTALELVLDYIAEQPNAPDEIKSIAAASRGKG